MYRKLVANKEIVDKFERLTETSFDEKLIEEYATMVFNVKCKLQVLDLVQEEIYIDIDVEGDLELHELFPAHKE